MRRTTLIIGLITFCLLAACGKQGLESQSAQRNANGGDERTVNLYIWSDYLAPDTLAAFEKQTGITVRVSYFDTNETLEARMLTGNSGFDVVVPTGIFIQRQIRSGAYLWFDMLAIPKDAPHVANAYLLIDYLLNPRVIANISNAIGFANANSAATPLLDASIASDTTIYPAPDQKQRLFVPMEPSPEQTRAMVVFPQPLEPSSASTLPGTRVSDTPKSARNAP